MSDKVSVPKKKETWVGSAVPLGYEVKGRALMINETKTAITQHFLTHYTELGSVRVFKEMDKMELDSHMLPMGHTASIVTDTARSTTPREHTEQPSLHVLEGGVGHNFSENQNR